MFTLSLSHSLTLSPTLSLTLPLTRALSLSLRGGSREGVFPGPAVGAAVRGERPADPSCHAPRPRHHPARVLLLFFFFLTLVTDPRRSLSLKLSDTRVYEPQTRARLGTTAQLCRVVVLKFSNLVRDSAQLRLRIRHLPRLRLHLPPKHSGIPPQRKGSGHGGGLVGG